MGIRAIYLDWFEAECDKVLGKTVPDLLFPLSKMLELGNQTLKHTDEKLAPWLKRRGLSPTLRTGKELFSAMGYYHVSIDINGLDGAVRADLRKPLPGHVSGEFDVVTSFGTAEHVSDQFMLWRNVHHAVRLFGLTFVVVPAPGLKHGLYQYPQTFFSMMATRTGATMLRCDEVALPYRGSPKVTVAAWSPRQSYLERFMAKDDFNACLLPLLRGG